MVHWKVKLPALVVVAVGVASSLGFGGFSFGFFW
jgi:hypothetical protein